MSKNANFISSSASYLIKRRFKYTTFSSFENKLSKKPLVSTSESVGEKFDSSSSDVFCSDVLLGYCHWISAEQAQDNKGVQSCYLLEKGFTEWTCFQVWYIRISIYDLKKCKKK